MKEILTAVYLRAASRQALKYLLVSVLVQAALEILGLRMSDPVFWIIYISAVAVYYYIIDPWKSKI